MPPIIYTKENIAKEDAKTQFVKFDDYVRLQFDVMKSKRVIAADVPRMIDSLVSMFGEGPHVGIHEAKDEVEINRLKKEMEMAWIYIKVMLPLKPNYALAREWLKRNKVEY